MNYKMACFLLLSNLAIFSSDDDSFCVSVTSEYGSSSTSFSSTASQSSRSVTPDVQLKRRYCNDDKVEDKSMVKDLSDSDFSQDLEFDRNDEKNQAEYQKLDYTYSIPLRPLIWSMSEEKKDSSQMARQHLEVRQDLICAIIGNVSSVRAIIGNEEKREIQEIYDLFKKEKDKLFYEHSQLAPSPSPIYPSIHSSPTNVPDTHSSTPLYPNSRSASPANFGQSDDVSTKTQASFGVVVSDFCQENEK